MDDSTVQRWIDHSTMSHPGRHGTALSNLPTAVRSLNAIVQGLLIHSDELTAYGLDLVEIGPISRTTRPVADRIDEILNTDPRSLSIARLPRDRSIGTCRDFALLLCSILRCKGLASRVRCGFATYFGQNWHDHWICEYWSDVSGEWKISDPQLDDVLKRHCGVTIDPVDIPRTMFQSAGEAWARCRKGYGDPAHYGHGPTTGPWFIKINVIRDHLALNGYEVSRWDGWRDAPTAARVVGEHETELLDRLAAHPDRADVKIVPDWLMHDRRAPGY